MDSMENRLAMIGIGETGYLVMIGAYSAGASPSEAFDVLTAFFVSGLIVNGHTGEEDEETSSS